MAHKYSDKCLCNNCSAIFRRAVERMLNYNKAVVKKKK